MVLEQQWGPTNIPCVIKIGALPLLDQLSIDKSEHNKTPFCHVNDASPLIDQSPHLTRINNLQKLPQLYLLSLSAWATRLNPTLSE